ncbi:SurA N-terminal domain-containing protein [Chromatium okenii]|uniref:SurA N-terminal domain-containing protein n=1 Tax=Chromatium okenii TaxID=61644 RepID=UPI001F5BBF75|nr:SurA N-terminal domain-containing protein [Chromatium okenii]
MVNDDVVVRSELNKEINLVLPQLRQQGTAEPPRAQLEKQVLDRLILKRLQRLRAKEVGIEINDATLNEALTSIAKRNNLNLDDLQKTLEAGGIRFNDFREDTRSQILNSRLQNQEVVSKIRVTEQK